ncbi:MAG: hypothetical protein IKW96_11840 [Ruminococcus sp.]|uniref:hypothetical protein n=1 Tax=Ruminococcus sp. TaxID=41978 RepID=UPI0025E5754C|nr:hypothetical protein [Ruminococcus sp.]MBR5683945.1 hypothetical protein [Ruminococcus sp.]
MKKKNIFDILENAEDELMDDFTDMSPGISDDQLEKLLAVSERNYRMKKKEIERTRKDNDTEGEYTVSGVDRIKRPVWLTPLITAASVVLIAGAVIGSVSLMKNNRNVIIGDDTHISAEQSGQSGTESTSVSGFGSATDTVVTVTALGTDNKTTKTTETATSDTTAVSTQTTSAPAADEKYTTRPFVAPKAEDIIIDDELSRYVHDMFAKSGDVHFNLTSNIMREREFLRFSVDPALGYKTSNLPDNSDEILENTVFYSLVNDERFTCIDDIRRYARTVFTEKLTNSLCLGNTFSSGFDDIDVGGFLPTDKIGWFAEYRGKLYIWFDGGGRGYVPAGDYMDELPVIISNKTDTSFTAYIQSTYIYSASDPIDPGLIELDKIGCYEVKFVFDSEFNDWRIDEITLREAPCYKAVYDKLPDRR